MTGPRREADHPGRVAALHARMILQVAARAGLDVAALQREAGVALPEELGVASFLPISDHERLYEVAARRLGDPILSLRMGESARGEHFDLLFYALRASDTLSDAASLSKRLQGRIAPHLRFDIEHDGTTWRWVVATSGPPRDGWPRREIEYLIRASLTTLEEIAERPVPVLEVRLGHPAGGPAEIYERSFGAPVQFSRQRGEILFPAEVAGWRPPRRDPVLARLLEDRLATMLGSLPAGDRVAPQAQAAIEEMLGLALHERAVAGALGMPVRTLQHRLRAEGTSYARLLDDVRRNRALQLVTGAQRPIAEISYALGYGDVRSFHRAFRRWTGCSPAAYREESTGGS